MAQSLQDVGDYFKGDKLPDAHPYQKLHKGYKQENNYHKSIKTKDEQFGYNKGADPTNSNSSYNKVKK
jgi:hypothetical protein